jgi:hypothetical protein
MAATPINSDKINTQNLTQKIEFENSKLIDSGTRLMWSWTEGKQ